MTECNQATFPFEAHFSRQVVAQFDCGQMSTEGGALLLREADRKIRFHFDGAARVALRLPYFGGTRGSPSVLTP